MRFIIFCLFFLPNVLFGSLADKIESQLSFKDLLFSSHFGGCVIDLETAEMIWSRNVDSLFIPASVTKVFTVAAALNILGPSYLFETKVFADPIIDGQVHGNLYLVGGADLTALNPLYEIDSIDEALKGSMDNTIHFPKVPCIGASL